MAAQVTSETWDSIWVTTGRVRKKRITDQVNNSNPTLEVLRAEGRVEFEDGGKEIQEDLLNGNGTMQWMSDWDELNTDEPDGVTAAFYPWRFAVVPIGISFTDEMKSRVSPEAAMKLMEVKTVQARNTINTGINAAIWAAQSGKSMLGMQDIIKTDPTTGSLGGLDQSVHTYFRNQVSTTSTNFDSASGNIYAGPALIGTQYEAASDGNDEIDKIALGSTFYGQWLNILEGTGYGRLQLNSGGAGAKIGTKSQTPKGIGGPSFRGADVYKDRDVPAAAAYGYSSAALKLKIMRGVSFAKTAFVPGQNQLAKVSFIIVGIQLTTNNPRRLFACTAFT